MEEKTEIPTNNNTPEEAPNSVFINYYVDRYSNPPFGKEEDGDAIRDGIEECLKDTSIFSGVIYDEEELNPAGFLLARSGEPKEMINQFEKDYRNALDVQLYGFDLIDSEQKNQHVAILGDILTKYFKEKYGKIGYIMDLGVGRIDKEWIDGDSLHELKTLIKYYFKENSISASFWVTHQDDYSIHLLEFCGLDIKSLGSDGNIKAFMISM